MLSHLHLYHHNVGYLKGDFQPCNTWLALERRSGAPLQEEGLVLQYPHLNTREFRAHLR